MCDLSNYSLLFIDDGAVFRHPEAFLCVILSKVEGTPCVEGDPSLTFGMTSWRGIIVGR